MNQSNLFTRSHGFHTIPDSRRPMLSSISQRERPTAIPEDGYVAVSNETSFDELGFVSRSIPTEFSNGLYTQQGRRATYDASWMPFCRDDDVQPIFARNRRFQSDNDILRSPNYSSPSFQSDVHFSYARPRCLAVGQNIGEELQEPIREPQNYCSERGSEFSPNAVPFIPSDMRNPSSREMPYSNCPIPSMDRSTEMTFPVSSVPLSHSHVPPSSVNPYLSYSSIPNGSGSTGNGNGRSMTISMYGNGNGNGNGVNAKRTGKQARRGNHCKNSHVSKNDGTAVSGNNGDYPNHSGEGRGNESKLADPDEIDPVRINPSKSFIFIFLFLCIYPFQLFPIGCIVVIILRLLIHGYFQGKSQRSRWTILVL